jgi:hypothetical protein
MFSPGKAILAGVFVLGIGVAASIATTLWGPISDAPAAVTTEEPVAPTEFTGIWLYGSNVQPEALDLVGRAVRSTGGSWRHEAADVTDPRFDGEVTVFSNDDTYLRDATAVYHVVWRVENADGAWQSEPTYGVDFPDGSSSTRNGVFRGEGAYEGLTAIVQLTFEGTRWELHGVILDGDPPPHPEPPRAE